jgi:hypothetical protein
MTGHEDFRMVGIRPNDGAMSADSSDHPARSPAAPTPVRRWALGECIVDAERHCVQRQDREFRLAP